MSDSQRRGGDGIDRRAETRTAPIRDGGGPATTPLGDDAAAPAPLPRRAADLVVGDFSVGEQLGAGGMGVVYRARDQRLGRDVALKLLRAEHTADPRRRARFLREARTAASLSHPNIAGVHQVGDADGVIFIAMELVPGESLRSILARGPVDSPTAIAWAIGVARALACAHDAGVVHRDLKPDNVMITPSGEVKLLDFGIAKALGEGTAAPAGIEVTAEHMTLDGTVLGTPQYVSPEQARGFEVDARTDVFSFGVTVFEMLTGVSPFRRATVLDTLVAVTRETASLPRAVESTLPREFAHALARCLEKDPAERFASGRELLDALLTAAPRGSSRGGRAMVLGAAALVVVGLVAAGASYRTHSAKKVDAAPVAVTLPACSARACAAAHGGQPWVCQPATHACVPVESQDCKALYEPADLLADDTIWFGAVFPTEGQQGEAYGRLNVEGVDFARQEFSQGIDALGGAGIARGVRRIAVVACNDTEDVTRAARHLVDDVGVPAIIGFRSGKEIMDVAGGMLIPHGVVTVATVTPNTLITKLPQPSDQPRLVWRTTFNYDQLAMATAHMVHEVLEPIARKGPTTRIALVKSAASAGVSFADTLYRTLEFNGKPALDNGHDYLELTIDSEGPEEIGRTAEKLADFQPSLVVMFPNGGTELALVRAIEARSPTKPIYVLANDQTSVVAPFFASNAERRRRVFATTSKADSATNARFVIRYNQSEHGKVTRSGNPGTSYDAFYALALATFTLPTNESVRGTAIAQGFSRLIGPGKSIEVDPTGIVEAFGVLASGGSIDLDGTQTRLAFDLSTGEASWDFVLLCAGADAHGGATGEDVESGVTYVAKSGRVEGSFQCAVP